MADDLQNQEPAAHKRANVLGVGVSAVTMEGALEITDSLVRRGGKGYICMTGVHGVIEAQRDSAFRSILNKSFLTAPDGMPTVWMGLQQGLDMERVYGPEFMIKFCQLSAERGYRHFLYGGNVGVAQLLKTALELQAPGIRVVGTYTPPFRPLTPKESRVLQETLSSLQTDVLWIGLSTPKQERFMAEYLPKLDVKVMVGVGAAFDINTGLIKDAPGWVKMSGLQWAHRLTQDYRRLWKRYLINNPIFVWNALLQIAGIRKFPIS